MSETTSRIRQFIIDNFLFGDASAMLAESDSLLRQGIVDSTGVLDLVLFIEDSFATTVHDDEVIPDNFDSVDNLAAFVSRKLSSVPSKRTWLDGPVRPIDLNGSGEAMELRPLGR